MTAGPTADMARRSPRQWAVYLEHSVQQGRPAEQLLAEMTARGIPLLEAQTLLSGAMQSRSNRTGKILGCSALLFFGGLLFTLATFHTASQSGGSWIAFVGAIVCGAIGLVYGVQRARKGR